MKPRDERKTEFDVFEILSWIGAACVIVGGMVVGAYSVFQTQVAASIDKVQVIDRIGVIDEHVREIRQDVKELLKQTRGN